MIRAIPKRDPLIPSNNNWFGYYAGFSLDFVEGALDYLHLGTDAVVVDPWNGSGTTTKALNERGLVGMGFDINPAIVLVARARLLKSDIKPSHTAIAKAIVAQSKRSVPDLRLDDPLRALFLPSSARAIRSLEQALQATLVPRSSINASTLPVDLDRVSNLAAFFFVAMFRAVRGLTSRLETSNPTWVKMPRSTNARLRPTSDRLHSAFLSEVERMFSASAWSTSSRKTRCTINVGDALALPLTSASVDAIISSPPYCTRIDYAVATRIELAVLGLSGRDFEVLRAKTLGSTIVRGSPTAPLPEWGEECERFLNAVKKHPSQASSTYYFRSHLKYFDGLNRSVAEISRALKEKGRTVLVVQDSYYKEIRTDLQSILVELAAAHGLRLILRHDNFLRSTKGAINQMTKRYRADHTATESVLVFSKG